MEVMEIVMLVDKHEFKAGDKVVVDENNKNLRQRVDWYLANNFAQICNGEDGCKDCKDKKDAEQNKVVIDAESMTDEVVEETKTKKAKKQ